MAATGEPSVNFSYHILKSLRENPGKTLLVIEGEAVTGLELHQRISRAVHLLKSKGAAPGHRMLITMKPSVDFYALAIASFAIGCCVVVLDPAMGLERSNHCITIAKADLWVWPNGSWYKHLKYLLPSLRSIAIQLEVSKLSLAGSGGGETPAVKAKKDGGEMELVEPEECVPVNHALVTFTTGSTGMPKLLLRKHSFILNQSLSMSFSYEKLVRPELGVPECDNVLCTNLPMFPLHYIKVGSCTIVYSNITKCNPAQVLASLHQYKVTALGGSPAFVEKIANFALKQNTTLPVKFTLVGGAPVFRGAFRTIASATPDKKAIVLYGSTEVEPISVVFAEEKLRLEAEKPDGLCVGKPIFENSAKIIRILKDPPTTAVDMADLELPRGQIGEIAVTGWHVNTYQVDSKRVLIDTEGEKWLRVEDAGYMDEEGRLWLVGRVKWRVKGEEGRVYWSTIVEQKLLDRCSLLTFAAYLPHKGEAWLFLEAPKGLPDNEKEALRQFIRRETIPVHHLVVKAHIPRDRRHASKPDTATIFGTSSFNRITKLLLYILRSNPLLSLLLILLQFLLIVVALVLIALS